MGLGTNVHMYRCAGKALVAAGIAVRVFPSLSPPAEQFVERVVTVALLCILFDGGMHPGVAAFPAVRDSDRGAGYRGHVPDRAAAAVLAHLAFRLDWYLAALLGTAVSPTDPALVSSVLGRREVAGRSGDIMEGDPARTTRSVLRRWRTARDSWPWSSRGLCWAMNAPRSNGDRTVP